MKKLKTLLILGESGALLKKVPITTAALGKRLGVSQQTASRLLIGLLDDGLITREKGINGYLVSITLKGKELLLDIGLSIKRAVRKSQEFTIRGRVVDGLQDGNYYLGLGEYKRAIKRHVGFAPYPGTLNIRLNRAEDREAKHELQKAGGIVIPGFRRGKKIFGSVKCFWCEVNRAAGAVIIPERSHYGADILEVISPDMLRDKLNLKTGGMVTVKVSK